MLGNLPVGACLAIVVALVLCPQLLSAHIMLLSSSHENMVHTRIIIPARSDSSQSAVVARPALVHAACWASSTAVMMFEAAMYSNECLVKANLVSQGSSWTLPLESSVPVRALANESL